MNESAILPGLKPVLELLRDNPTIIAKIFCRKNMARNDLIMQQCRNEGVPFSFADNRFLDKLCGSSPQNKINHQGVVALISQSQQMSLEEFLASVSTSPLPLGLVLDQVQDPGNVGAICRTAYFMGCAGIMLCRQKTALLGPAAYKASAGTLEKLPFAHVDNLAVALDTAEEKGLQVYGALGRGSIHADAFAISWNLPALLVLGSENRGIRPHIAKRCSQLVAIPHAREFDSLNVAQAAAILIGLAARQIRVGSNIG